MVEEVAAVAIHSDWRSEVVVRETPQCTATVKPGVGYQVRLRGYTGAVFIVDEDGCVTIGQSSRMRYNYEMWNVLQQELQLGYQYMARVKLAGTYGRRPGGDLQPIKPRDYRSGCVYKNAKGQYILYIGRAAFLGTFGNREGCEYIYGKFSGDTSNIQMSVFNFVCDVCFNPETTSLWLDSYVGKPIKLVECIWTPPSPYTAVSINGHDHKRWRYL